jgi:steroid delta-isomerase-like uncharacterized protein
MISRTGGSALSPKLPVQISTSSDWIILSGMILKYTLLQGGLRVSTANQDLAKRWFEEVWNQKRREAIAEMLHPDVVFHEGGIDTAGADAFYQYFDRMHASFSDFHVTVHDALEAGDKVCVRWSCSMRHTGDGLGFPPTGKIVEPTGISIMRIAEGQLIEGWQNWDMAGVLEAIGVRSKGTNVLAVSA